MQALQEALEPRLRLSGDMKPLEEMKAFFAGQNFQKGMNILLLARPEGILEFVTGQAGTSFAQVSPAIQKCPSHKMHPVLHGTCHSCLPKMGVLQAEYSPACDMLCLPCKDVCSL